MTRGTDTEAAIGPSDRDAEQAGQQLELLTIGHYLLAGFAALLACVPGMHLILVGVVRLGGFAKTAGPAVGPIPKELNTSPMLAAAAVAVLIGWGLAGLILLAGRRLHGRRGYTFCLVVAAIECIFMPFGTVLGVLTLCTLNRPEVRRLFDQPVGAPTPRREPDAE
jgi:hypothetical protein